MLKTLLAPETGHRTYRLMLFSLASGLGVAVLGILHGSDPVGLAAIIAAVSAPVSGFAALNNRGVAPTPQDTGKDA